jgi:hypothetical protein
MRSGAIAQRVIATRRPLAQDDLGNVLEAAAVEARAFQGGVGAEHEVWVGGAEAVAQLDLELDHGEWQAQLRGRSGGIDAQQFASTLDDQPGAPLGNRRHELALHQGTWLQQVTDVFISTP